MKLCTLVEGTGEQTLAFSDYMSELMEYAPDNLEPKLLKAGSHAIKQGMIFHPSNTGRPKFTKGTIQVLFPSKSSNRADMNKVNISSSGANILGHDITLSKFANLNIDAVQDVFKKIRDAELELAMLMR